MYCTVLSTVFSNRVQEMYNTRTVPYQRIFHSQKDVLVRRGGLPYCTVLLTGTVRYCYWYRTRACARAPRYQAFVELLASRAVQPNCRYEKWYRVL